MNTRPLEIALAIAKQLQALRPEEQRAVLLILADLVKATPAEELPSAPPPPPGDVVPYAEAAERLGINIGTLYMAVRNGRLKKYGNPGRGSPGKVSLAEAARAGFRPRAKRAAGA
jgi:hypothetical protein